MKTKLLFAVIISALAGCSTVTSGGVTILAASEAEYFVEFHPEVANQLMIQKTAQDHCRQFGKEAHILEGSLGGLWTNKVKYACLTEVQVEELGLR